MVYTLQFYKTDISGNKYLNNLYLIDLSNVTISSSLVGIFRDYNVNNNIYKYKINKLFLHDSHDLK